MSSQFAFLQHEFPEVHDVAHRAEALANFGPGPLCFCARRTKSALTHLDTLFASLHDKAFSGTPLVDKELTNV